jgi:metal-dependent amidase/aminoacylase/carboxypeptidase family protein
VRWRFIGAAVDLRGDLDDLTPGVIALHRQLHRYPELAFEEVRTAGTLAARMRALGLVVDEHIGGTGDRPRVCLGAGESPPRLRA